MRMNNNDLAAASISRDNNGKELKDVVRKVFAQEDLASQRHSVNTLAAELDATVLDCAAALLNQNSLATLKLGIAVSGSSGQSQSDKQNSQQSYQSGIRSVRYRLDLGNQHNAVQDEIKKVLVEESGVDIKNITNIRILDDFTLIDLPDEMPQEIFHHLKLVEINGRKLDIRRVKSRNKKHGNRKCRRDRFAIPPSGKEAGQ
jgi:coenzyme F420-reducing hydrogenase beta subunit